MARTRQMAATVAAAADLQSMQQLEHGVGRLREAFGALQVGGCRCGCVPTRKISDRVPDSG